MILLLLASGIVSVIMGQIDDAISITVVSILFRFYKLCHDIKIRIQIRIFYNAVPQSQC